MYPTPHPPQDQYARMEFSESEGGLLTFADHFVFLSPHDVATKVWSVQRPPILSDQKNKHGQKYLQNDLKPSSNRISHEREINHDGAGYEGSLGID